MEKQKKNETRNTLRKKIMQGVLGCLFAMGVMLLMLGAEIKAQASQPTVELKGITYELDNYSGRTSVFDYDADKAGKEVHIPAEIEVSGYRYSVTGIASWAFAKPALEKITLEEGIEIIGAHAFGSSPITEIKIPGNDTAMDGLRCTCRN